jgi:hypothetical protein
MSLYATYHFRDILLGLIILIDLDKENNNNSGNVSVFN